MSRDHTGRNAVMFARGADSRLRGEPEVTGHMRYATEDLRWWLRGWNEVHYHYGKGVDGRWPVPPLPPVREEITCGH